MCLGEFTPQTTSHHLKNPQKQALQTTRPLRKKAVSYDLPVTRRRNSNTSTAGLLTCFTALRLPNTLRHQWHQATPSPAPLSGATGTKLTAASTVSDSHRIPF